MKHTRIIYGTAWKKDNTAELVYKAVNCGFRAIDTACQPRHYNEIGVGQALKRLYEEGTVKREDIFLQTKFTAPSGQDLNNIPYKVSDPLEAQVQTSFYRSCENLGTCYLDSYLLHSPLPIFEDTLRAWRVMETLVAEGKIIKLGISNCYDVTMLKRLWEHSTVKPSFLQNRFYRETGYDRNIRNFCNDHDIQYESFWTLTANGQIVNHPVVQSLAFLYKKTPEQIFFNFVSSLNITFLTGTSSLLHMKQDLEVFSFTMTEEELSQVNQLLQ